MSKSKALFMISMLFVSMIVLTGSVSASEGKVVNVDIALGASKADNSMFYNPSTVSIEAGTTVSWMNLDKDPHTVTDGTPVSKWGQIFDSGMMRQGKEYRYTFNEPGTYPYLCALHPWMFGKVIVENPVKTSDITIIQKLNVFIRSENQSYSEDQVIRFTVDVFGAGNLPTDPDSTDAQFGAVGGDEPKQVNMYRLDVGKYAFSTTELKPASYTLIVKASKNGFEPGYSILTVQITKKEPVKDVPKPSIPWISIAIDQAKHNPSDTVMVSGNVSQAIQNKSVVFMVSDPENKLYTRGQTELKSNGTFEWAFKVADTVSAGMWTVKVKYMDVVAITSFEIAERSVATIKPEPVKPEPIVNVPTMTFKNEKVTIARSAITDQASTQLSNIIVRQPVILQSVVRNNQETEQTFVYIVQIKNFNDVIVKLEAVEGVLPAGKSFTVGVSWTPETTGNYAAETFVWKSLKEPVPLSLNLQKTNLAVTS